MHQDDAVLLFKAFAHETRIRIVKMLLAKPGMTASELVTTIGCTQPTLSHHMKILVECQVVDEKKEWKWVHYEVNQDKIEAVFRFLVTPCRYAASTL